MRAAQTRGRPRPAQSLSTTLGIARLITCDVLLYCIVHMDQGISIKRAKTGRRELVALALHFGNGGTRWECRCEARRVGTAKSARAVWAARRVMNQVDGFDGASAVEWVWECGGEMIMQMRETCCCGHAGSQLGRRSNGLNACVAATKFGKGVGLVAQPAESTRRLGDGERATWERVQCRSPLS